ncbi:hypothetical protein, partial [Glutamicibacter creatinolyticus]|uniref:hypothetical protein n=1 Tax=Glutamicibacter creatinolyticus TaxID=162496 RepID=UPI003216330F
QRRKNKKRSLYQTRGLTVGWVHPKDDDYEMHDYLNHQKSKAQILEHKAKKTVVGAYGGHTRHHVKKGVVKPGCYWCEHPDEMPNP